MLGRQSIEHTRGQRHKLLLIALFCASLLPLSLLPAADGQGEPAPDLPLLSETNDAGVRPELQALLEDVEAQLQAATDAGDQENIDRLIDLRGRLQVIQLQVELEELQNENANLLEQDANAGRATGEASPEMAEMQEEVESLNDMQASTIKQLNDIAEQHAALLEQMGLDMPGMTMNAQTEASAAANSEVAARLREVRALNARFQTLADQQNKIGEVLKVVSTEHANLLAALGVPEPAHADSTYTVQAGDSLSSIAVAAYGDENRWSDILRANPFLTDPGVLYVGSVLMIP